MRGILLLLTATALLTGCARATSDTCPRLIEYSRDAQRQAANEIAALPKGSMLAVLVADYGVVRQEIRICRGD